jgi:AraC-like DNA-binding protein
MNMLLSSQVQLASANFEMDCGAGLRLLQVSDGAREATAFEFGSERSILVLTLHCGGAQLQLGDATASPIHGDGKVWIIQLERGARLAMAPGATYALLKMSLDALERIATGQGVPMHAFSTGGEHAADAVLENFVDVLAEHVAGAARGRSTDQRFCRAIAVALEHHVLRTYAGSGTSAADTGGALAAWQLQTVKDAILGRLDSKLEASELARMCGISTSHFRRAFFASTGMSLHRWVIRQRVEQVCGDLLSSTMPMADIALRWGFSDQSHLSRTFVAVLGIAGQVA